MEGLYGIHFIVYLTNFSDQSEEMLAAMLGTTTGKLNDLKDFEYHELEKSDRGKRLLSAYRFAFESLKRGIQPGGQLFRLLRFPIHSDQDGSPTPLFYIVEDPDNVFFAKHLTPKVIRDFKDALKDSQVATPTPLTAVTGTQSQS